jgi:hypothetical protein
MALTVVNEDASGPISGLDGVLTIGTVIVANMKKWNIKETCGINKYSTGDTSGWKKTLKGIKEWSGSADILIEQGLLPALVRGTLYAFSGICKTSGTAITGTIRMGEMSVEVDVESGAPIAGSISFEGHGALVQGA